MLSTLFFYGTLRHLPLLEIVLGRSLNDGDISNATLQGHQPYAVAGESFPIIVTEEGTTEGVIVRNLTETEVARLNFYEGGFDYALKSVPVETSGGIETAEVYFPTPDRWQTAALWSLQDWQNTWGELSCLAAQEAMSFFGQRTDSELDFMFPMIRVRAAQKLQAQRENRAYSPSGFGREDVKSLGFTRPYTQFFGVEEHEFSFKQYDGTASAAVKREVFMGTDAAILLPYDPVRDRVMLVEQFRPGPFVRNDDKPWVLEPIAGRIDPGETPEQSAHREAAEEAGITISALHKIGQCYASPGCSTEYFFMFLAETDLPDDSTGVSGLASESEDIKSYLLSFDELMELVDTMQAANAPLVLCALWLARHRDRLRAAASR